MKTRISEKINISFKRIQQLAIPAIFAGIAEPILSSTDAAVVGNMDYFPTESLAAVGIVGSFLSMLIWVLGQTRSAISAILSQYLGAGKVEEVSTLPAQAIAFNIALAFVVLLSTVFFIEEIFSLYEADGKLLELCGEYYYIRVFGFPLTLLTFAIFGIFRGLQNTFWPMIVALIGAGVNVILDFALVYGIEGFLEPMNLKGAAWASLISQAIMAVIAIILLVKKTQISLKLKFPLNKELGRLAQMSLNLFGRSIALNVALILATREATSISDETSAAHTIALNLWLLCAFFIDGYGAAGNILGGRLKGASDYKNLYLLTKRITFYGIIVSIILAIAGFIGYSWLGNVYTDKGEVLYIYQSFFFLVLVALPFNALAFVLDGLFKGMGEMGYLRNVLLLSTFVGFVPTLYITKYFGLGIQGIWIAFIVWILFRGLALVYKFRKKYMPLAKMGE